MPKYPARPSGAPTKLTPEITKTICNALLIGNYFETACAVAGIHRDTAYEWLKKGAKKPGIHRQFSDAVEKAQADAESRDLTVIEMTAHGTKAQFDENGHLVRAEVQRDWKAAAWRLERKHPKKWGRIDRHEITGKDGGPLTLTDWLKEADDDDKK